MKILLIGGTGLIGPYVIQEIYSRYPNASLSTITRSGKTYFCEHAIKADRNDHASLEGILKTMTPDVLVDMIPFTVDDATITSTLVKSIQPELPVIALSSIDIYAAYATVQGTEDIGLQACPITEDMDLRTKLSERGAEYDKLNVERIYQENLKNVTLLRLPATYGWPDKRRIDYYLDAMLDGQTLIEMPKQNAHWKFSRCLHKNAAYAVFKTIEANQSGHHIYNVAEKITYSEYEWCQKIALACGWHGKIQIIEGGLHDDSLEQDFYVSSQKIRDEIGFTEKYDPDEGLYEAVKLYAYDRQKSIYKQCY